MIFTTHGLNVYEEIFRVSLNPGVLFLVGAVVEGKREGAA
jgi:hypothetical protein